MFLTPINIPVWAAFLAAIFYGLMGALIGVSVYRKKYLADMESLGKAYDDLDAQYNKLLSFYTSHSNNNTPIWLYVPKVFDLEDPAVMMVDTSFALRFSHVEDIEKLIRLIEENYKLDEEVTMRDILDFCYCPSCSDDAFFGLAMSPLRAAASAPFLCQYSFTNSAGMV